MLEAARLGPGAAEPAVRTACSGGVDYPLTISPESGARRAARRAPTANLSKSLRPTVAHVQSECGAMEGCFDKGSR